MDLCDTRAVLYQLSYCVQNCDDQLYLHIIQIQIYEISNIHLYTNIVY